MYLNNYEFTPLRTPTVLTNSYVPLPVLGAYDANNSLIGQPNLNNQLILYVNLTLGSLTTAELIVEFSHDGLTNWVQETYDNIAPSSGIVTETPLIRTFAASGNFRIPIKINDQHIRVSVHGTGTVTGSLMGVNAIIGNN